MCKLCKMPLKGEIVGNIIAVIFDFDDTLAPDTTTGLLKKLGVDIGQFWESVQQRVDLDWDPVPAYLFGMIELSHASRGPRITADVLQEWAREAPLFNGAGTIFNRIKKHAGKISQDIAVEFYCISSGIGDVIRNTKIARHFRDIWSCEFHFDRDGSISYPKKIISFTDKTRYIFQISKGIVGEEYRGQPFVVNKKVSPGRVRIPFDQMIVVGDGLTDVPCFSLVRDKGGIAIGVYDRRREHRWGAAWEFIEEGRVSNLVSADYGAKSDLSNSLFMAVEGMAKRIALKNKTYQG